MNVNELHSLADRALKGIEEGSIELPRANAILRAGAFDLSIHRHAFAVAKATGEGLGISAFLGDGKKATKATR